MNNTNRMNLRTFGMTMLLMAGAMLFLLGISVFSGGISVLFVLAGFACAILGIIGLIKLFKKAYISTLGYKMLFQDDFSINLPPYMKASYDFKNGSVSIKSNCDQKNVYFTLVKDFRPNLKHTYGINSLEEWAGKEINAQADALTKHGKVVCDGIKSVVINGLNALTSTVYLEPSFYSFAFIQGANQRVFKLTLISSKEAYFGLGDIIFNTFEDLTPKSISPNKPISPVKSVEPTVKPAEKTDDEWKEYFRSILNRHFSQYTILEDVPVTQLTGDTSDVFKLYKTRPNQVYKAEWGRPYDFVIYENGKVKAIMIIGHDRSYQNVKYLIAKMFAKKLQVPYIGFYKRFANEEDYVVERIRKELEA